MVSVLSPRALVANGAKPVVYYTPYDSMDAPKLASDGTKSSQRDLAAWNRLGDPAGHHLSGVRLWSPGGLLPGESQRTQRLGAGASGATRTDCPRLLKTMFVCFSLVGVKRNSSLLENVVFFFQGA